MVTEEQNTDQAARQYALTLLNRAEIAFDVRDIHTVAAVLRVVEDDMADWLDSFTGLDGLAETCRNGLWRQPTTNEGPADGEAQG